LVLTEPFILSLASQLPEHTRIKPILHFTERDIWDGILARRKEAKQKTLQVRKEHNRKLRELNKGNSTG